MNTREIGSIAEQKAVEYLLRCGFEIVDRNFYIRGGEIDIIAKKDAIIHFVEVKSGDDFEPIYNVTPTKLQRIIKTALVYLQKHKLHASYQIDVITIHNDQISFVENVTMF
ncbi:MAG: YraN family protein [Epsilonproteobacteria bacterium]|nr:YraN family protein [Campylobacterota bacterium]